MIIHDIRTMRDALAKLVYENVLCSSKPRVDETRRIVHLNLDIKRLLSQHYNKPSKVFLRTCLLKDIYPELHIRIWHMIKCLFCECTDPAEHIMLTISVETGNPPVEIVITYHLAPGGVWERK